MNRDEINSIIISVIWGFGVASLFRKICKNKCIVIKVPNDVDDYIVKDDKKKCYNFVKSNCNNID